MRKIFIPLLMMLSATAFCREANDTTSITEYATMSLRKCMEYALKHSTKLEIQQLNNADVRIDRRDAILRTFTPSISAGSNVSTSFGRAVDPETNTYINTTSLNNGYSVSANLTLFNGFSAINNIKISKTAVKMGMAEEEKQKNELCLAVMEAYYNVIYHSEMADVLSKQVEVSRSNLLLMKKQYELGQKSLPDVAQTEADLADREYQLTTSINSREDAILTLKSVMLWPVEEPLVIDRSMARAEISSITYEVESVAEIIDYATENQPSALIAKGDVRQSRLALRTAKWQFLPSISVSGGWSTNYFDYPGKADYQAPSFKSQWRNNSGEYIQLNLSFPLYDRLSRFSNLSRKKNEHRRAEARYRQTMQDIESEVTRAVQDTKGAAKALAMAVKRKDAQKETYMLHQKKMTQGIVSTIEFQTITNSYLNAKAEAINALLTYYLKKSVVKYYKGISYIEQ